MKKEKPLRKTNAITIMEYIKSSIDILVELKVGERLEGIKNKTKESLEDEEEVQNSYETLLRKLEGDIRGHIRVSYLF